MLQRFKIRLNDFKFRLPKNQLKSDYFDMLHKLRELEAQVEKNAKQLEMAKSSFLKNLYHEIRTPLNAIMGFTNLLAKDYKIADNEREEYLSVINSSSSEFLRIMDDIVQASLLEAGMIKISKENCNLGNFFNELYSYFSKRKHLLGKHCVALLMNVSDSCKELDILCDKFRLQQVMSYLIENALKFTEKGVVEFGCNVKNKNIKFFVKDTGIGELHGKEKYIFSRFAKMDVSDNSKNGLGLGLSNSKRLVDLMHGKIWYSPNGEKGTNFIFSIPYVAADSKVYNDKDTGNFIETVLKGQNSLAV